MATIQELREKKAKLVADARAIIDKAGTEKREMTADEQVQTDKMLDDAEGAGREAEGKEKAENRSKRLGDLEESLTRKEERRTAPTRPGDDGREKKDEVREISWRVAGGDERRIRIDNRRGSDEYRRKFETYLVSGRAEGLDLGGERRDLQADVDTGGGYLLAPMQMAAGLIKAVDDQVVVRQYATVLPLTSAQNLGVPTLDADPADADWTTEIATGSKDTAMKFGKRELNPSPLAKRILVSRKLLRLSPMGVESLVQSRLAYKFAITEEKGYMTGTGANQPLGLFTASANGISTGRDSLTGSATDVTADGLIDAKFLLKPQYWGRPSTRWVMHRDALKRVRKLKDTTNQYLWQPGLASGEPDRILDIPYVLSEYAPNTFTTGLYVGIRGDLSFYWIAQALSLEIQRLNELYAESNQVGYIGRMELDAMPVLEEPFVRLKTN